MVVEEVMASVDSRARGRTRYVGKTPCWDEVLVNEVRRLRGVLRGIAECDVHDRDGLTLQSLAMQALGQSKMLDRLEVE